MKAPSPGRPENRRRLFERHGKLSLNFAGSKTGWHNDSVGTVRVIARQPGVVASDFRPCAFGIRQEVQIVDRDDLRGVARRHEQGMQRVCDVELRRCENFGGGPAEPMPRQIEQRHRYASIDAFRTSEFGGHLQTIFPGTGE